MAASLLSGSSIRNNIYVGLILRLLIIMFLFSLCRVGFYLFNIEYFPGITANRFVNICIGGLRFDLVAVLYTNALYILLYILPFKSRHTSIYQSITKWIFYITNTIAIAANVIDFVYFRFTGRRTTYDIVQQFENETNLSSLFFRFVLDYWYVPITVAVLVALMIWLYKKVKVDGPFIKQNIWYYTIGTLVMPLVVYLFIIGVRGGAYHHIRPITLNDAGQYVEDPRDVILVLNTPFAVYRTLGKTKIKRIHYYSDDTELQEIYSPLHTGDSAQHEMKKLNVVIIVLESFSKEFIGFYNSQRNDGNYKGYTPFLDSLLPFSQTYRYSFANGRKSIDAMPSVIASIPSMGIPYVLTPFSGNKIESLGSLLGKEGYETAFFHGAPNGSMGFQAFMNVAGIKKYYGMDEYNNKADFDGWWGIWDEKFMLYTASQQNTLQQPFLSVFFSLSSHHPYELPKEYEGVFKGGDVPVLRGIQYTDNALRKYFNHVKQEPWFENTLFVITADHVSSNVLFDDGRLAPGQFSIPIAFYRPDNSLAQIDTTSIIQQVDIMPTVLNYLGYQKPYLAFGRDTFSPNQPACAWNYENGVFQYYEGDYLLQFNGEKSVALYDFKNDKALTTNLVNTQHDIAITLESRIKAIIQQYNNRMVDNDLVYKDNLSN